MNLNLLHFIILFIAPYTRRAIQYKSSMGLNVYISCEYKIERVILGVKILRFPISCHVLDVQVRYRSWTHLSLSMSLEDPVFGSAHK